MAKERKILRFSLAKRSCPFAWMRSFFFFFVPFNVKCSRFRHTFIGSHIVHIMSLPPHRHMINRAHEPKNSGRSIADPSIIGSHLLGRSSSHSVLEVRNRFLVRKKKIKGSFVPEEQYGTDLNCNGKSVRPSDALCCGCFVDNQLKMKQNRMRILKNVATFCVCWRAREQMPHKLQIKNNYIPFRKIFSLNKWKDFLSGEISGIPSKILCTVQCLLQCSSKCK